MIPYFVFDRITLGPIELATWGLLVGLAFTAGYFWLLYQARQKNIWPIKIIGLALAAFIGAIIGARLLFLLQTPADFLTGLKSFNGGAMFYGGLLGGVLGSWLYLKAIGEKFWPLADLTAPAVALGIGIGRLGCFLINDHQGSLTSLPWGILWPDGLVRHPVALYESLAGFILFALLWYLKNKLTRPGQLFLTFMAGYAIARFGLDFFREAQSWLADPRYLTLTFSQWLSIGILAAALFWWPKKK
ncbi:MAG TPA: prolipoprotein diacylglyceryl transferase [Candidatus Portnoybacteria bacterium]|uniref:Phosphatidylglycerol--prolipoprotein diacylglyceryl transferase n=1 Tax=Candidatus Portnoybacteria bacterium CG02_land_8_20_14_3_00_45_8 TaxID=1974807 RepID=A0A2M7D6W0_9BACT|nr:MAG: prolipoprotein diacylglyceryl transferase [Candidatus Portnoybacteria bacterium CG02_land_8_20_14_3_00_45_8]HCX28071.1 prolipoprotein diacylglyceryl transferase [Candidatus Portnoybacteria bacterium]